MKIVDRMPGKSRHPWDEWFDGKVRLLERDVDFHSEPTGLVSAAHNAAKARGLKVSARVRDEGVYLQAIGKAGSEAAAGGTVDPAATAA